MTDYKAKQQQMTVWWQSSLGQYVLQQEKASLQRLQNHLFGSYQLQVGGPDQILPPLLKPGQQIHLAEHADLNGQAEALPCKSHSIDQLLLMHMLEYSADPHQVLREAERVLVADGTLVLCSFNPLSLWGLRRLFSRRRQPPWSGHFFTLTRLKDWMALLNFEVMQTQRSVFQFPCKSSKWLHRFELIERWGSKCWPFFSGVTILVAKKRTIPLTPVMQHRSKSRLFATPGLANKLITRDNTNG